MSKSRLWGNLARRVGMGSAAAALLGVTAGCLPMPAAAASDVAKIIDESHEMVRKGDLKSALIRIKKGVKENPDNGDIRAELGILEVQTGDMVSSESDLRTAAKLGGPAAKVNPALAASLYYQGKMDEVISGTEPCPDDNNCKALVLAIHARAHLALKQIGMAEADSKEALAAAPEAAEATLTRGMVLIAQGDFTHAEQIIDELLASHPKSAEALITKGDLRRQAGDFAGAERAFGAASELSPKNLNARVGLAAAQLADGKNDEAQATVDTLLAQAPKSIPALYLKAMMLTRANKAKQALDVVRPVEASIAKTPRGVFLLALIHADNGNLEEAVKYAGTFHSQEPDDLVGTRLLASINFRLGAYDRVVSILAPIRDRLVQDSASLNLLSAAYMAEGRVKEANDLLADAVRQRPDDLISRGQLALSKTRQAGTREQGIHELEALVTADPKSGKYDLVLISTLMANGDYDRAVAAASALIAKQPDNPVPLTMRGAAKLTKGDEAGAGQDFEQALLKKPDFTPAALYQAEIALRNGDFPKARSVVDQALAKNPADIRALLARGRIEERAGDTAAAVPVYERAVAAHPDDLEPRTQLVEALLKIHDTNRAITAANDLARTQAGNPSALDLAAKVLVEAGQAREGAGIYRQLQGDLPKSPIVSYRLGLALQAEGDLPGARDAFDRAIGANPGYLTAWISRLGVEKKLNGLDSALALAEKAAKANTGNEAIRLLPGDLYAADGRWADAEAFYRKQIADTSSTLAPIRLFAVLEQGGNHAKALQFMADWLAKHPDDTIARSELAQAEMKRKDFKEASEQFAILAKKMPRNVAVLNNLAWIYGQMHDPRAVETAKQAYNAAPNDGQVADTYGELLYRNGDMKDAAVLLRQAHNVLPQDPSITLHLAQVLNESKDRDGARTLLRGIVESKVAFAEQDDAKKLYAELGGS